jgi:hypothetical protein
MNTVYSRDRIETGLIGKLGKSKVIIVSNKQLMFRRLY